MEFRTEYNEHFLPHRVHQPTFHASTTRTVLLQTEALIKGKTRSR